MFPIDFNCYEQVVPKELITIFTTIFVASNISFLRNYFIRGLHFSFAPSGAKLFVVEIKINFIAPEERPNYVKSSTFRLFLFRLNH